MVSAFGDLLEQKIRTPPSTRLMPTNISLLTIRGAMEKNSFYLRAPRRDDARQQRLPCLPGRGFTSIASTRHLGIFTLDAGVVQGSQADPLLGSPARPRPHAHNIVEFVLPVSSWSRRRTASRWTYTAEHNVSVAASALCSPYKLSPSFRRPAVDGMKQQNRQEQR